MIHQRNPVRRDVLTGAELSAEETRRETSIFRSQGAAHATGALGGAVAGGAIGLAAHGPVAAIVYGVLCAIVGTVFANAVSFKQASRPPLPAPARASTAPSDRC